MRPVFKIALYFLIGLLVLAFFGGPVFTLFFTMLFGWFRFLQRTLPQMTLNWDLIGMALLCCVIILLVSHRFLSGISKSIAAKRGIDWSWPWKWTWSLLGAVFLLFVVGMSVAGATHQIGWIASSKETLFERKGFYFTALNEMKQIDLAIRIASGECDETIEQTRNEFWRLKEELFDRRVDAAAMLQKYSVLVMSDDAGKISGTIIFPRDPVLRGKVGGYCFLETEGQSQYEWNELRATIQKYSDTLVVF